MTRAAYQLYIKLILLKTSCPILGCPAVLRCDYGTENTSLGTAQIAFRMNHTDSMAREKSFVYGPSKSNIVSKLTFVINGADIYLDISYTENRGFLVTAAEV